MGFFFFLHLHIHTPLVFFSLINTFPKRHLIVRRLPVLPALLYAIVDFLDIDDLTEIIF